MAVSDPHVGGEHPPTAQNEDAADVARPKDGTCMAVVDQASFRECEGATTHANGGNATAANHDRVPQGRVASLRRQIERSARNASRAILDNAILNLDVGG